MKNFIFTIFIISCLLSAQRGQWGGGKIPEIGRVYGTVLDTINQQPIEYASIALIDLKSDEIVTGGVTNKDGYFNIEKIPLGRYRADIEFIGFEKKSIQPVALHPGKSIEADMGTVYLQVKDIAGEAIDVVADAPMFVQEIDKKVFNVDQSLTTGGDSASELLKKVPSVDVDIDGNISLRGSQNVTVLINGKPSTLTHGDRSALLDNVPADMVEKVEVITSPSAKYDPDGMAGIINIILKKGTFDGLNGTLTLTAGNRTNAMTDGLQNLNLSSLFNYKLDKFNLSANFGYRKNDHLSEGSRNYQYIYPSESADVQDSIAYNDQTTKMNKLPENLSGAFGLDYFLNEKNTLMISGSLNSHSSERISDVISDSVHTHSEETEKGQDVDLSLDFERLYEHPDQKLNAGVHHSFNIEEEEEEADFHKSDEHEEDTHDEHGDKTHTHENKIYTTLFMDYVQPYREKGKIETGFKSTIKGFDSELELTHQPYNYTYKEKVHALYASVADQINIRFGYKAGLRAEQVLAEADVSAASSATHDSTTIYTVLIDSVIASSPYENNYFKIYPSGHLLYNITEKNSLQLGYSKRVNRPRIRSLNPFPRNTTDRDFIRNGNPYLKPEFIDAVELNYMSNSRKLTLNAGLYYQNIQDVIKWWDADYDTTETGEVFKILSADNGGSATNHGLDMMVNYRPLPFINLTVGGTSWNSVTKGSQEADLNGSSTGYFIWSMANIFMPGFKFELSSRYRGKMNFTNGYINPTISADLGLQKSFGENISLTLKVKDLFDSGKFNIHIEEDLKDFSGIGDYIRIMDSTRRRNSRTLNLVLKYSFGELQKKRKWGNGKRWNSGGGMEDIEY